MITLHVQTQAGFTDITQWIKEGSITWSDIGDESVSVTLPINPYTKKIAQFPLGVNIRAYQHGKEVWGGRLHSSTLQTDTIDLVAYGDIYRLEDQQDYTAFWSQVGFDGWKATGTQELSVSFTREQPVYSTSATSGVLLDAFAIDFNNRAYISLRKNASVPNRNIAQVYFEIPQASENTIRFITAQVRYRLPTGWGGTIAARDITGGNAAGLLTLTADGVLRTGVIFYETTATDKHQIYIPFANFTGGTYTNTQNDGHWFVEMTNLRVMSDYSDNFLTTVTTNTVAGSGIVFTPSSMTNITPGNVVTFRSGNGEVMMVTSVSGGTFTADALFSHSAWDQLYVPRLLSSTVAGALCNGVGITDQILIQGESNDLRNLIFDNVTKKSAFDRVVQDSDGTYEYTGEVRAGALQYSPVYPTARFYYLDQAILAIVKDVESYTSHARVDYKSLAGFNRTTEYTTAPTAQLIERKRRFKTATTNNTSATETIAAIFNRQLQKIVKTSPKGGILYNQNGGRVTFPIVNKRIVIKNIVSELYGISGTYYLKKVVYDFETGEWEYVVDIEEETFDRLLAGK